VCGFYWAKNMGGTLSGAVAAWRKMEESETAGARFTDLEPGKACGST